MITYTLTCSRRKTIALRVRGGELDVRAPLRTPKYEIDKFITQKTAWISKKLAESGAQAARREGFTLGYGSLIPYRGAQYPIEAKEGGRAGFDGERFYAPPDLPPEQIKAACVRIYRKLAGRDLTQKTLAFAAQMRVSPEKIRITSARTRWGSCSGKKYINYSWRLIMAGDDVIDYVVVHELAHMTEMKHSERFWGIVARALPDYRRRKAGLKELQRRLAGENWD